MDCISTELLAKQTLSPEVAFARILYHSLGTVREIHPSFRAGLGLSDYDQQCSRDNIYLQTTSDL